MEFFQFVFKLIYLTIQALVYAVVPTKFLPKKSIKGDTVLITGAGGGLGRQLALEFAKNGAFLYLWDVDHKGLEKTRNILKENGYKAEIDVVDLRNPDKIMEHGSKIDKVDILVHNAGVATGKDLFESTPETIRTTFDVNVISHFHTTRQFLPKMLESNKGHIVTVASVAGKIASHGLTDYHSSKFGAVGFHESMSAYVDKKQQSGVKTTLICPYYINTPMFDGEGARTKLPWLVPILEIDYAARKIVEAVLAEMDYLIMPKILNLFIAMAAILPKRVSHLVGDQIELIQSTDRFNRKRE